VALLEALKCYTSEILAWLAIFSIVVEVAPIKVNPWTAILKSIGSRMNADILTRLKEVETQLEKQDAKIDNNEKDRIRFEILDFARTCRKHEKHTKEEFDHIFEQYDKYEVILASLEQPNGKVTQAMHFIGEVYQKILVEDDFIA
jgi:hypothetical protein